MFIVNNSLRTILTTKNTKKTKITNHDDYTVSQKKPDPYYFFK